jgi:hypothetical protein
LALAAGTLIPAVPSLADPADHHHEEITMIRSWFTVVAASLVTVLSLAAAETVSVPQIWNDTALADWATPIAGLNVRPGHYSSAEYYSVPGDNLRTYPVYHPDAEPPGYWDELQKKKPEPLLDTRATRTAADWVTDGARVFREMDNVLMRTADPQVIAQARDARSFEGFMKLPDGTALGPRWVVTDHGVMLTVPACAAACHIGTGPGGSLLFGGPGGGRAGSPRLGFQTALNGPEGTRRRLRQTYPGDDDGTASWREFTTPWAPDERIERMRSWSRTELELTSTSRMGRSFGGGVFARANTSPFIVSKMTDLQNLRYSRYLDATATHRLRGPEDLARYTALVSGADPLDFGPHRILTDEQRRMRFRYADELLYALGAYMMALEPPRNPAVVPPDVLAQGERVFRREGCVNCHTPPDYTNGKLTLAQGWTPPADHPNRADILPLSVGTDPGLALRTRKGTGLYKIPSLRGVWYRPRLLHDGSLASLEEMFAPARLDADYQSRGWNPPDTTSRAISGHTFGLALATEDKAALLAFLRSL